MGLRRALLLASLWRARTDEDLTWGSLEQQADDDFVPTLAASNVTAYLMMPYAHCIDCAEGTGSWCAGATALYEAAVEPAETICVGHTLEEWEAAVAAVLAKHDDPADVLFVPFWIRSDWMQSFAGPLKNGSTAVLVGGAANGVMMYPDLDYGPAPPANHSYDAKLFMVGPNNYEGSYAQAREFCRITESEDKRHVVMTTVPGRGERPGLRRRRRKRRGRDRPRARRRRRRRRGAAVAEPVAPRRGVAAAAGRGPGDAVRARAVHAQDARLPDALCVDAPGRRTTRRGRGGSSGPRSRCGAR